MFVLTHVKWCLTPLNSTGKLYTVLWGPSHLWTPVAASPSVEVDSNFKRKPRHESRVSGAGPHRPHVVEDWPPHLLFQEEKAVGTRRRLELAEREAPAPHVVLLFILDSLS